MALSAYFRFGSAYRLCVAQAGAVLGLCLLSLSALAADESSSSSPPAENPLLQKSTLDFEYPPFNKIKAEHFEPAFAQGIAEQAKEIEAISTNSEPPTFENTIAALERSGQLLDRVKTIFTNLSDANTSGQMQELDTEMAPKLSEQRDGIYLNEALFLRIETLYRERSKLDLDSESKWLLERYERNFVRAGAKLSPPDKNRLKKWNAELASLQSRFAQNLRKEPKADAVIVEKREELAGLSPEEVTVAGKLAAAENKPGKFVIPLESVTQQPSLTKIRSRPLRERIMQASLARNSHGGAWDNRAIVRQIVKLSAERATLLGYKTFADYQLEDQTAGNVATVRKFLTGLVPPATANARQEATVLQELIDKEHSGFQLASWDWDFYSEQVHQARFAFDESEVKSYLELDRVLTDGVFYAATQLYGITFKERRDLPVYQPGVRVFEVHNEDGSPLALLIADLYARPSKRGGSWMKQYVYQSKLLGTKVITAIHLNISQPETGQPVLLSLEQVGTLFHEFGHALHAMFSDVEYPSLSGTRVPTDFVEYPGRLNEFLATWPELLQHYARHYKTGQPMPKELLDKFLAAQKFDQGSKTTAYLASALLDQAWYQLLPAEVPDDVLAFEAGALKKAGLDFAPVPPRFRTTYFSHIFGDGYSAGYYSYMWDEEMADDTLEFFQQHGGLTRANGDRFRATILSRGGSADAMELFRDFTGRDPWMEPLLRRRGLDQSGE